MEKPEAILNRIRSTVHSAALPTSNYGFPMVVAGYLLLRLEPTIKDLQKSINLLSLIIAKQSGIELEEVGELINGYMKK